MGHTTVQLAFITLLPVALCLVLALLHKRTKLAQLPPLAWQVVAGICFGIVAAVCAGIEAPFRGASVNMLDAAPLAAGLFFGGPAGIIAGFIGAAGRWFAVAWGASTFTQLAGSLGCALAGLYAALLRKHLFDDRMPHWPMALATAIVVEVLHLLLIFITNYDAPLKAFELIQAATLPTIACVSFSTTLSAIVLAFLNGQPIINRGIRGVAQIVQNRLLIGVIAAFMLTIGFTALVLTNLSEAETASLLRLNIDDVEHDIIDASDANLLSLTKHAASTIGTVENASNKECARLADELDVAEIHVIDKNGFIVATNVSEFVNFDMRTGEQSSEFLVLLPGGTTTEFVQSYQPIAYDSSRSRKYAGISIEDGFVQVGYDAQNFLDDLSARVEASVKNRHVGQGGALIVVDEEGSVISTRSDAIGLNADRLVTDATTTGADKVFQTTYARDEYYACYEEVEGYRIIAMLPTSEANFSRDFSVLIMSFMEVLVFAALFLVIYFAIKRVVVRSIWQVNGRLGQITNGDLDVEVDVRGSTEFASLSDDINQTVGALKDSIAVVQADLDMAADIQANSLPVITPEVAAYPEFDLHASMEPAKEVGGDFYDFFLIDDDHLGMVVADVSGKGVPAALFMMKSKTVIKMEALSGQSPEEVLLRANADLSEKNDDDMFTTAWIGVLEISTGTLTYADAGHEKLALYRNGSWELPAKPNGAVALGAFTQEDYNELPEKYHFRTHTLVLQPGDALLQYTDGVTEATDEDDELFGEDRLLAALNSANNPSPETILPHIRDKISEFVKEAPQFDDITMLGLLYKGPRN